MSAAPSSAVLELPPGFLEATHLTSDELRLELALTLFQQQRLSFGKARELAELSAAAFQQELGRRGIAPHYDVGEFDEDVATLRGLGRL